MRKSTEPHMLIHLVLGGVGVVLLLAGYSVGLFLLMCAVMMWAMMGGHGRGRTGERPGGSGHH
jgi:hypothetical protein